MNYEKEYNKILRFLPYKIKKRINKTAEGRSGLEIYKKRNRRNYRVIIQYKTFRAHPLELFDAYNEGYAVLVSPEEYFGDNYPNPRKDLYDKFELGKNGFIYYSSISELNRYKPLNNWLEVLELSTTGDKKNETWIGQYVLNIKNSNPKQISEICTSPSSSDAKKAKKEKWIAKLKAFDSEMSIPEKVNQCGLGNYDYDYAEKDMILKVKLQMLLLIFNCSSKCEESFPEFVVHNFETIKHNSKETQSLINELKNADNYIKKFTNSIKTLKAKCEGEGLLDYGRLIELGCLDKSNGYLICPLCHDRIYIEDFFEDVEQMEGREVADNTQKEIVLMHIKPLRPAEFNHCIYNLGWGHNYCNLIQGDKSISDTVEKLEKIIESHKSNQ